MSGTLLKERRSLRGSEFKGVVSEPPSDSLRCSERAPNFLLMSISVRARSPAEFKHINKRRKRNQQEFP